MNHLVIMAGGIGSRFWPMSTASRPKQFIDVLGVGKSLLQLTAQRFKGIVPMENVWVVTNKDYEELVKEQLPGMPDGNVLLEPCRRNTAPCIAYVCWKIRKQDPDANIVVSPSDHVVTDTIEFQRIIGLALDFTASRSAILTLGMKPSRPETGYGYIQARMESQDANGICPVAAFREKPDLATAQTYIAQDNFFWNAGIFVWNVQTIVEAFKKYQPEMAAQFDALADSLGTPDEQRVIDARYADCTNISIDYAVMEKADNIFVCPADFGWSDLGTWGSLYSLSDKTAEGNVSIGAQADIRLYETTGTIVHAAQEKRVIIRGLKDYIVVESEHNLLICPQADEQSIKDMNA